MADLFSSAHLGSLVVPNRLIRSATAERMSDPEGRPTASLLDLYRSLVNGGVGLIITGHMFVDPGGKCHAEMTGIHDDALVPALASLTETVQAAGGLVAAQINHGGLQCSRETVTEALAPSDAQASGEQPPARAMRDAEIEQIIDAYAQAARRAQAAGFDAVQLHGAHGYLISQFLSPYTNRRTDAWGGDLPARMRFLREVCRSVRAAVARDYPVLIKLGMADGVEGGLSLDEGVGVVAALADMDVDGVEISHGIGGRRRAKGRGHAPDCEHEADHLDLARAARQVTPLPIILVGGLRSRTVMDEILARGDADFISLSRPLICEPDLPARLRMGQARSACISGNRCWPKGVDEGIACRCRK